MNIDTTSSSGSIPSILEKAINDIIVINRSNYFLFPEHPVRHGQPHPHAHKPIDIYRYIYRAECETVGVRVEVPVKGPPLCRKAKDFECVIWKGTSVPLGWRDEAEKWPSMYYSLRTSFQKRLIRRETINVKPPLRRRVNGREGTRRMTRTTDDEDVNDDLICPESFPI